MGNNSDHRMPSSTMHGISHGPDGDELVWGMISGYSNYRPLSGGIFGIAVDGVSSTSVSEWIMLIQ
jgi:hypothetical protein